MKETISYGLDENSLTVWYGLDAVKEAIPRWELPARPVWENTRSWFKGLKIGLGQEAQGNNQSGRGRGSRGSWQPHNGRGRGGERYERNERNDRDDRNDRYKRYGGDAGYYSGISRPRDDS